MVAFVAERVAEHLADAGEFVLAVETEDHAEEPVELGAFHDLAEEEDVAGEEPFIFRDGEVEVAAEGAAGAGDELVFAEDGGDLFEHGLALVRVDPETGDHVEEAVGVDIFLVGVAAEDEFEFGCGDEFADDVLDIVADDAFSGGEVADAHADDPAFEVGDFFAAPLLDVGLHLDVFRFPVIGLHGPVEFVGPVVFEREEIEGHAFAAIDDAFGAEGFFGFGFVEEEGFGADGEGSFHGEAGQAERFGWVGGAIKLP